MDESCDTPPSFWEHTSKTSFFGSLKESLNTRGGKYGLVTRIRVERSNSNSFFEFEYESEQRRFFWWVSISNMNTDSNSEGWHVVYVYVYLCRYVSRYCSTRTTSLTRTSRIHSQESSCCHRWNNTWWYSQWNLETEKHIFLFRKNRRWYMSGPCPPPSVALFTRGTNSDVSLTRLITVHTILLDELLLFLLGGVLSDIWCVNRETLRLSLDEEEFSVSPTSTLPISSSSPSLSSSERSSDVKCHPLIVNKLPWRHEKSELWPPVATLNISAFVSSKCEVSKSPCKLGWLVFLLRCFGENTTQVSRHDFFTEFLSY